MSAQCGIACDTIRQVRVVLDTNVLVAGFRSRRGASFRLLTLLRSGAFEIAVSVPLVLEYEAVLRAHAAELSLSAGEVTGLVDYLCSVGRRQAIHFLWRPALRDPADEFVLELAVAAECDAVVTHNVRDFAGARTFGVQIITPAALVRLLEERS
jgi:putative PIN family toxin of toxin-antitoxin system